MIKKELFDPDLQMLSLFARSISHPARLAILKYLSETKTCISGDISDFLPLSRTTVSQHLKELKEMGLIHGTVDGLKVNYCLCGDGIEKFKSLFESFFNPISVTKSNCKI
jgi:ArsR family transcriptional regulator, arsenate/arsenite/antimonite-responsive transcriptional repressor